MEDKSNKLQRVWDSEDFEKLEKTSNYEDACTSLMEEQKLLMVPTV